MKTVFTISSDTIPATEVAPVGRVTVKNTREREQVSHLQTISELLFRGDDFSLIQTAADCEKITILVECDNDGTLTTIFEGAFTTSDCKYDLDNCTLKVTPYADDNYRCLLDAWEDEENIYYAAAEQRTAGALGVYEMLINCDYCCSETSSPYPCYTNPNTPLTSCEQYTNVYTTGGAAYCTQLFTVETCWHRMIGIGTPTTPPPYGTGWTYLSGNNWWRCPTLGEINIGVLSYGRRLNTVVEYIFQLLPCTLTPRSHFFNFNNNHSAPPVNDAYDYAETYLQNLTIHQKSDVKRPDASNKAAPSVWVMSIKDLLDDLRTMFNVYWKIEGDSIIIEHISYFDNSGADLSALNIKQRFKAEDDGQPKTEKYFWSDDYRTSAAFGGYPIIYGCGSGEKEHRVRLFTNDILEIAASANAEHISDRNFCLVSNEVNGTDYAVLEANAPLGFVMLHENLHKYYRYFDSGNMNDTPDTSFLSVRKSRKLEPFSVSLCCGEAFDVSQTLTLKCGDAHIYATELDLTTDKLKIDARI
jgi:hypothetical protein